MGTEQGSLFEITEHTTRSVAVDPGMQEVGSRVDIRPAADGVYPAAEPQEEHAEATQLAEGNFDVRNEVLLNIVDTGGYLSQLGKRETAARLKESGWMPQSLREHQASKGDRVEQNLSEIRERYNKELSRACGTCALSQECEFAGEPDLFRGHFSHASTRQKLVRSLKRDPETKCDTITQSKSRQKR